jgi:hypothetical protein
MHTVELLEEAIAVAEQAGYEVREEWLGGTGGGYCEIRGQKCIFLDLAVGPLDQLGLVLQTLHREPNVMPLRMSSHLRRLLGARKSA